MTAAAIAHDPSQEDAQRDYKRFPKGKMPEGGVFGRDVGARLMEARLALGWRHEDVAQNSNGAFARVAYTNYENGKIVPGPEKIFLLADILKTTAKWLYFGDTEGTGNVRIVQSEFISGRWIDSEKTWGMSRDWLTRTFKDVNPDAIYAAEIEHSESSVVYTGDIVLVDSDVKPSETPDDFVYSAAGAVHVGEVIKVAGGYDLRSKDGKRSVGVVTAHQVRFLGRVIGSLASLIEPAPSES